jgi:hypothetical protein
MSVLLPLASLIPHPVTEPVLGPDPKPFLAVMLAGFVIGALGHLFRSRIMVAIGVVAVFGSTFLLPLALYLSRS